MLIVELEAADFDDSGDGFVKIGRVHKAIVKFKNKNKNISPIDLLNFERKVFAGINAAVQLGKLTPLDSETLSPLPKNDYGTGIVTFAELVEWGQATLFDFRRPLSKAPFDFRRTLSKAPPPITPVRGHGHSYMPKPSTNERLPNWAKWKYMPEVELWQACVLALNFDPDSMMRSPHNWMASGADIFETESFPSDEVAVEFKNLTEIVKANNLQTVYRKINLPEFAAWCAPVVRDLTGRDIPPELAALVKAAPQAAPIVEAAPVEQGTQADDHEQKLAALFDPAPVEALEKMFPVNGKWKNWADKAKANGLIDARESTAMFNPYKAGVWFVKKGVTGWDTARLNRTLANNLPARSLDDKHLLTGDLD